MRNWVKSYRDLEVWKKGMSLVKDIYQTTARLPDSEKFGLVNQMRRAAVSIPSNIAEGHARSGTGEYKQFISFAMGSIAELETQIILSSNLGYLNGEDGQYLLAQLSEIGKMLRGLSKALANRQPAKTRP